MELRARHALATVALFATSSLVLVSMALGPLGADPAARPILKRLSESGLSRAGMSCAARRACVNMPSVSTTIVLGRGLGGIQGVAGWVAYQDCS